MLTVSDHIRLHALNAAKEVGPHNPAWLYRSQWVGEFEHLMRNRLVMGYLRYGPMTGKPVAGHTEKYTDYIRAKLHAYVITGNTEMLVDLANLAMMEFVMGDHPNKHFKAIDRD
jgi:hypothetical protein